MARGSFDTLAAAILERAEARRRRKAKRRAAVRRAADARASVRRKMRAAAVGFVLPAYPRTEAQTS